MADEDKLAEFASNIVNATTRAVQETTAKVQETAAEMTREVQELIQDAGEQMSKLITPPKTETRSVQSTSTPKSKQNLSPRFESVAPPSEEIAEIATTKATEPEIACASKEATPGASCCGSAAAERRKEPSCKNSCTGTILPAVCAPSASARQRQLLTRVVAAGAVAALVVVVVGKRNPDWRMDINRFVVSLS